MTRISFGSAIGAFAALVLGTAPASAQLMNESSQVIALPGNPPAGEPGLGMSDVVKEFLARRELCLAISGATTARHGTAENHRDDELDWPET